MQRRVEANSLPSWLVFPYLAVRKALEPRARQGELLRLAEALAEYLGARLLSRWVERHSRNPGPVSAALEAGLAAALKKPMAFGDWNATIRLLCQHDAETGAVDAIGLNLLEKGALDPESMSPVLAAWQFLNKSNGTRCSVFDFLTSVVPLRNESAHG